MGRSQRAKGNRGELEVVHILNEHGIDSRRGNVFYREPDIMDDTEIHWEVKRCEKTEIGKWYRQSCEQGRGKIPVVVHRRSREDWMITMKFEDFLRLWKGEANGKD